MLLILFLAADCTVELVFVLLNAINLVLFASLTSWACYWCAWKRQINDRVRKCLLLLWHLTPKFVSYNVKRLASLASRLNQTSWVPPWVRFAALLWLAISLSATSTLNCVLDWVLSGANAPLLKLVRLIVDVPTRGDKIVQFLPFYTHSTLNSDFLNCWEGSRLDRIFPGLSHSAGSRRYGWWSYPWSKNLWSKWVHFPSKKSCLVIYERYTDIMLSILTFHLIQVERLVHISFLVQNGWGLNLIL